MDVYKTVVTFLILMGEIDFCLLLFCAVLLVTVLFLFKIKIKKITVKGDPTLKMNGKM